MTPIFKSVALLLAIALLAAPAAALATCWAGSGEAPHDCAPDCSMMAMMNTHPPAGTVRADASGTSCCDISSGKPNPPTQLQVPTDSSRTAVTPPQSLGVLAVVPVSASADSPGSPPSLPAVSAQAVLCTFLI